MSNPGRLKFSANHLLAMAIPTLFPAPCPNGPDVVSTPVVRWDSGCPGVLLSICRKRLISSIGTARSLETWPLASAARTPKVQRCVEQHRRMARGEHETIAIWPRGIHGVVAEEALPQAVDHRRKTHGGPGMARICLLHGVDCESPDRVDAQ